MIGKSNLLLDQPRPLCILSKEVGPCSNQHVPLWQTPNDVTYCQQLVTDQAGGWAAAIALSWWCCHWMAGDIRLVNALNNNNNNISNSHTVRKWTDLLHEELFFHVAGGNLAEFLHRLIHCRTFRQLIRPTEHMLEQHQCYPKHHLHTCNDNSKAK